MTASNHATGSNDARRQLDELLDLLGEEALTADGRQQLNTILREHPELLGHYLQSAYVHAALTVRGQEMPLPVMDPVIPARSASEAVEPGITQGDSPIFGFQKLGLSPSTFRISAFAAVVAFIVIGILVYSLWPGPSQLPVVQQTPAAKIANQADAKWKAAFSPAGNNVLTAGQRLMLKSGSAEITFNSQARVILEGPAELTIVDAAACRLAGGKLVAHVSGPAKGFKVHTPDGTVTDLGTEFGVYVNTGAEDPQAVQEEEQQTGGGPQFDGKQPPVTEVHVFKGQVVVAPGDQLAQATGENPPPQSEIRNQKSKILSAGEAVTISKNKVQPLPAADPFQFALDKLHGRPRTVLLTEDFEALDRGPIDESKAPWIVRGTVRQHQGVAVIDPAERLAAFGAPLPEASAGKLPFSQRAVSLAFTGLPPNVPPLLGREIDGRELARRCQVLIEFDLMPEGKGLASSLAFASAVEPGAEIVLWKDAEFATWR
ncbi:MAG: FecR family protein [Planctomycetes bacterium]|nr:FecR family protein [Planctomycetota bacterium]